ncbi:uncharacterized protein LOC107369753 isoform X15 [Tetranychus urticae]|uniref:uncharacterized protein LOC107369753 isoform X15 n=1 Tax=Tetranychus urticae TaxID=32264 RepID=UPI000D65E847|nr:uncharacterized protein LOC107369753 isoform X15 [Tetranychus urticae]
MLINEIPNDCLLAIFDYIIALDDLINCYQVCVKWSYLLVKRTKKVKYLIDEVGYSSDTVYYQRSCLIDSTCLPKLFTNLIIAEMSRELTFEVEDAIEFVKSQKSLKGLINRFDVPIEKYCDGLEMLSVHNFDPNNLRNSSSMKQLDIWNYSLEALKRDAHYLPNIERLRIQIRVPDNRYDGPVLEKLEILEFYYYCYPAKIFHGFQLMDSCPNLQSAHIFMNATNWFFDETLKHKCLQDLFIDFYEYDNDNWNNLKRLLMKFPNLKLFALWGDSCITDEHIEQLVHILPNLVLLDVRKCNGVTRRAADYVKDHCKRYGRLIKFYFNGNKHEIRSDSSHLTIKHEAVSRGFDFMKHCDKFFDSN